MRFMCLLLNFVICLNFVKYHINFVIWITTKFEPKYYFWADYEVWSKAHEPHLNIQWVSNSVCPAFGSTVAYPSSFYPNFFNYWLLKPWIVGCHVASQFAEHIFFWILVFVCLIKVWKLLFWWKTRFWTMDVSFRTVRLSFIVCLLCAKFSGYDTIFSCLMIVE